MVGDSVRGNCHRQPVTFVDQRLILLRMFFVLPIRSDRKLAHVPWVNYSLIAVNVFVFVLTTANRPQEDLGIYSDYWFHPTNYAGNGPALYQFFTYQFMHAGWQHLLGNMLFLYVFGNSVEDRLGKVGYLFSYMAGGIVAALGHAMTDYSPVLGASGSVAGVSGAYMALFPQSNVTLFFWILFRWGTTQISSIVLILFYVVSDFIRAVADFDHVAYTAHLAGYAWGLSIGMSLLWLRILPREPYDLISMWTRYRRRRTFKKLAKQGYRPWESQAGEGAAAKTPDSPHTQAVMEMRQQIATLINDNKLPDAARKYVALLKRDENQLMNDESYEDAARAYELLLSRYPRYTQREQAELVLALICARYLNKPDRARELLGAALPRLTSDDQKDIANRMLAELGG